MKNVTYLLGAGASYHACPIWKEQAMKMIAMANSNLPPIVRDEQSKSSQLPNSENIILDIGYFGNKALEYGTIDTYARKLFLTDQTSELRRLKVAVSMFFTLWQIARIPDLKTRKLNGKIVKYEDIDLRYIQLLAAITDFDYQNNVIVKPNINFVTWNYDLQLELAFKKFNHNNTSWDNLSQRLKFRNLEENEKLQICHLNGYHGFYQNKDVELDFLTLSDSNDKSIPSVLDEIDYIPTSAKRKKISLSNHINYAWESNPKSVRIRDQAQAIFKQTDILVIIGYSFPNFNKEIDKTLFDNLKGRSTTIIYQDPNASKSFIEQLVNPSETDIITITDKMDNFYLPYEF